ncbi:glycosyltransferase [Chryseobacterium sp. MDT2-18]|uniref:glycosyltransferase n=1 Tax=Chryseobacterium sp. MDT2-18 TaxID=1259136 RepID=UPI0027893401|nr:glycosyltransferase [Chryseobacterium sp. MDT2-18]MDQ0478167.1 glycosyltransferase involved in cell wall biosynthesis [Chryseobacterium sp. MDT2-18]
MKVLQIIDSLPATSGGARFVVNLVKKLAERNIDCQLLLIDGAKSHFLDELNLANIKIISLDDGVKNRYRFKYIRKIAYFMTDFDLVHVHVFPSSYMVAAATLLKKDVTVVFTEHNSYNRRATNWVFKLIEKFVYSRFNKIICLSDQVLKFVTQNLSIPLENLCIIENAIDTHAVINAVPYSKKELGYENSDWLLLMSARFTLQKNHKVLIEAMCLLPEDVKLLLAGDGILKEELEMQVYKLGLTDRIQFLGSRKDVFRLMKSVDINVLSSNFEGLSLAALEAMTVGKPFIASNVEGLDFVVQDPRLLFENNPKSIAMLVSDLINNEQLRKTAVEICAERSKKYDIDVMVDKYIEVYEEVLKKNDGK